MPSSLFSKMQLADGWAVEDAAADAAALRSGVVGLDPSQMMKHSVVVAAAAVSAVASYVALYCPVGRWARKASPMMVVIDRMLRCEACGMIRYMKAVVRQGIWGLSLKVIVTGLIR